MPRKKVKRPELRFGIVPRVKFLFSGKLASIGATKPKKRTLKKK